MLHSIFVIPLPAAVPQLLNYQGRVAVGTVNFDGTGAFKFALVNTDGTTTYWSNDGTSTAGSQPTAAVALTVTKGLYSVQLGDTTLANMTTVPASAFANADVRLRVWFDDGVNGSQLLTPDQRITAVGYAMMAGEAQTVADGAITGAKIAAGAVGGSQLGAGAVTSAKIAVGAVGSGALSSNAVNTSSIADGSILNADISNSAAIDATKIGSGSVSNTMFGYLNGVTAPIQFQISNVLNGATSGTYTGSFSGAHTGNGSALTSLNGGSLQPGSVGSDSIADSSIANADISNSAAIADTKLATISTAGKVANSATTATTAGTPNSIVLRSASGIIVGTIDGGGLISGSVSGTSIANGSITDSKLATISTAGKVANSATTVTTAATPNSIVQRDGAGLIPGTFNGSSIVSGSIGSSALSSSTVNTNNIADGSIFNVDIASTAAIDAAKIGSGSVSNTEFGFLNGVTAPIQSQFSNVLSGAQSGSFTGSFAGTHTGNGSGLAGISATNFSGSLAGDVTGTQGATVVSAVAGVTAADVAAGATLANEARVANIANTLVKRSAGGNFSAGTITAENLNVSGTVTATVIQGDGSGLSGVTASALSSDGVNAVLSVLAARAQAKADALTAIIPTLGPAITQKQADITALTTQISSLNAQIQMIEVQRSVAQTNYDEQRDDAIFDYTWGNPLNQPNPSDPTTWVPIHTQAEINAFIAAYPPFDGSSFDQQVANVNATKAAAQATKTTAEQELAALQTQLENVNIDLRAALTLADIAGGL
ncbi:MAG TPA: hypothetical protein DIT13_11175 [Verrucomicrobiales bacterium]|nr:hypothetical protein [Verrucomicrobiales bacterium]